MNEPIPRDADGRTGEDGRRPPPSPVYSAAAAAAVRGGSLTPRVPLGGVGGQGDCYPEHGFGEVQSDLGIVSRALADPLYPVRPALRLKLVRWIEEVIDSTTDDRVRAKAITALATVDGHNLSLVRLRLEERRLQLEEQRLGLDRPQNAGGGVTVILEADLPSDSDPVPEGEA